MEQPLIFALAVGMFLGRVKLAVWERGRWERGKKETVFGLCRRSLSLRITHKLLANYTPSCSSLYAESCQVLIRSGCVLTFSPFRLARRSTYPDPVPLWPAKTFSTDDPAAIDYLHANGYVVFNNVADAKQRAHAIDLFWNHLEAVTEDQQNPIKRDDPRTYARFS